MMKPINETKPKNSSMQILRTVNNKQLKVNITQTWHIGIPKSESKKKKLTRINGQPAYDTLFINFNDIPSEIADELLVYCHTAKPDVDDISDAKKGLRHIAFRVVDINNGYEKASRGVRYALNFFESKGYKVPSLDKLLKKYTISPEGYEKLTQQTQEKWIELLSDLGKPETMELVDKYVKRFSKLFPHMYGHQLSFRNAQMIIAQKPDATLVMTEQNWKEVFNCTVNEGAQPIRYIGRFSDADTKTDDEIERYARSIGDEHYEKNNPLFKSHVKYDYRLGASASWAYCTVIGYDSSEVTPINKEDDWRETRYGMINNLTGEPNALTSSFYDSLGDMFGGDEDYSNLRAVLNDNAATAFRIAVLMLKGDPDNPRAEDGYDKNGYDQSAAKRFAAENKRLQQSMQASAVNGSNPVSNTGYIDLARKAISYLIDVMLQKQYSIAAKNVKGALLVKGVVGYALGIWDATSLSAVKGGNISRDELIGFSNIINDILTKVESQQANLLDRMKKAMKRIENMPKPDTTRQYQQAANESIVRGRLNEMKFDSITPGQLASLLDLNVVDDSDNEEYTEEFDEPDNTKADTQPNNDTEPLLEYYDKEKLDASEFMDSKNETYDKENDQLFVCGYPIVYQCTMFQNIPSIFANGFDRAFTGTHAGNMYGPGLYTTFKLTSSLNNLGRGAYGDTLVKMAILTKFNKFLIFDATVAQQVYGKNWKIKKQLEKLLGDDCNILKRNGTWDRVVHIKDYSGENAVTVWHEIGDERLINHGVGGFIFRGRNDGYVCVVRDFKSILPLAYKRKDDLTWRTDYFSQEIVDKVSRDVDFRTFVGDKLEDFQDTKKTNSELNKNINNYIKVKTSSGKYNFMITKTKKLLCPIDFDSASPFRENGMAYVEINDFGGNLLRGYVSKNGFHMREDINDFTPWKEFKKFAKQVGYINENVTYRVRWKIVDNKKSVTETKAKVMSEGYMECKSLKSAKDILAEACNGNLGKKAEHLSIEKKIGDEYKYLLKETNFQM